MQEGTEAANTGRKERMEGREERGEEGRKRGREAGKKEGRKVGMYACSCVVM